MSYDITSPQNERIKWLVRLRDRRHRDAEGVFVVEGERLFRRAIDAGLDPVEVFGEGIVDGFATTTVSPQVMDRASYRKRSEGVIGVFEQIETGLDRVSDMDLLLVTEDIEKPGNLGAMLRTASAAGAGVVAVGDGVDVFNPNVLRSSTGALFTVPLAVASLSQLASFSSDMRVIATSPQADMTLWEIDLTGPTAILIGAEDVGLTTDAQAFADQVVRIPQSDGATDSLNASVAAGIVLFEAVRQRSRSV